jgi:hypothetical protein
VAAERRLDPWREGDPHYKPDVLRAGALKGREGANPNLPAAAPAAGASPLALIEAAAGEGASPIRLPLAARLQRP